MMPTTSPANRWLDAFTEVTPDEIVAHTKDLVKKHGFKTHKLKGGHFPPEHDVEVMQALGAAFPNDGLRLDPNSVWGVEEAIQVAKAIGNLKNEYFEDPTWGLEGMRRFVAWYRQYYGV